MILSKKKVLKYVLLPGIFSRIHALLTSGFGSTAYFIAVIYQAVRLLPAHHPYLLEENIGKYGIRHVIGEAANNLSFSLKNIDQILVFFTILLGLVLLAAQFILLIIAVMSYQPVLADDGFSLKTMITRAPENQYQDLVMIMLDRIFGIPGMFHSCISELSRTNLTTEILDACKNSQGELLAQPASFPFPFHIALRNMLQFYSYGLFFVGIFIILYFVTVIVSETAASGTPFGERYNKTWIPMRLILFFALLIPMESGNYQGLNMAQVLTFWVAKSGSNFASNSWDLFNDKLMDASRAGEYGLVAAPEIPQLNSITQFIYLAKVCKAAEEGLNQDYSGSSGNLEKTFGPDGIQAYIVRPKSLLEEDAGPDAIPLLEIAPAVPQSNSSTLESTPKDTAFKAAREFSRNAPITIRFGSLIQNEKHRDYELHKKYQGNVRPVCGDLSVEIQNISEEGSPGYYIQAAYFNLVQDLWGDKFDGNLSMGNYAECFVKNRIQLATTQNPNCTTEPDPDFYDNIIKNTKAKFDQQIGEYIKKQAEDGTHWDVPEDLHKKGWAGAAIWYNRIADLNGKLTDSIMSLPEVRKFPIVMEEVALYKQRKEENVKPLEAFNPEGSDIEYDDPADREIAPILNEAFQAWNMPTDYQTNTRIGSNTFLDTINFIFGTSGIYDMLENPNVNPLAQLSTLGKGMMNASIRNIGSGFVGSNVSKILQNAIGATGKLASDFLQSVGYMSLTMSFSLFYILPLMPFIYFFFAITGWIKSIFEAIVAVPLWAVAHISQWDGEGIAGPAAKNGYFLLFEIFMRPIMVLFGLVASIAVFSALVMVLNDIFTLVIENVSGDHKNQVPDSAIGDITSIMRGPVDELFFTVVYTVTCYMIGLSAFKLVDAIPNTILRWIGFTTKTFQEENKNAAEELSGMSYRGTTLASSKLSGQTLSGSQLAAL